MLKELLIAVERLAEEFLSKNSGALVVEIQDCLSRIKTAIEQGESTLENSYLLREFDQLLTTVTKVLNR
jgi:hypothetical protein